MLKKFLALLAVVFTIPTNVFALPSVSSTSVFTDYSVTPVDTTTPLTIISKASYPVREVHIFDSSGQTMKIHIVSGPYITDVYIPPGGDNYTLKLSQGDSLTIVGVTGSAVSGWNIVTLLY